MVVPFLLTTNFSFKITFLQNYRGVRMLSKHVKILDLTTIRVDDVIPVETMGLFVRRLDVHANVNPCQSTTRTL